MHETIHVEPISSAGSVELAIGCKVPAAYHMPCSKGVCLALAERSLGCHLALIIITPTNASQELMELLCGLLEKDPAMRLGITLYSSTQHLQGAAKSLCLTMCQAYGEAEEDLDRQRQRVEKDHTKLSEEALLEMIATEKENTHLHRGTLHTRHCLHW
ncbi:hypothetical protein EMCRGX_G002851 [Ephydatia muelleri]